MIQTSLIISISLTNNNILINLSSLNGHSLHFISAGLVANSKGTKKTTITSLKTLVNELQSLISSTKYVHVKIKGLNKYKRSFLKLILKSTDFKILSFCDKTSLPHNGCKSAKIRRV